MFLGFFQIAGMSHPMLFLDLMSRVLFIVLCVFILLIIGYNIRRPLGAGFVLIYGFFIFMRNYNLLWF